MPFFPTMDLDEKNVTEMLLPLCLALERTHTPFGLSCYVLHKNTTAYTCCKEEKIKKEKLEV